MRTHELAWWGLGVPVAATAVFWSAVSLPAVAAAGWCVLTAGALWVLRPAPSLGPPAPDASGAAQQHHRDGPEHPAAEDRQPTGPDTATPEVRAVGELADHQLHSLWRASFWALREADSPAHRALVVALREECLDEIARRDPDAFAAWLGASPRPWSWPGRRADEESRGAR